MFKYTSFGLFFALFASGVLFGVPHQTGESIDAIQLRHSSQPTDELITIIKQHDAANLDLKMLVALGRELFVSRRSENSLYRLDEDSQKQAAEAFSVLCIRIFMHDDGASRSRLANLLCHCKRQGVQEIFITSGQGDFGRVLNLNNYNLSWLSLSCFPYNVWYHQYIKPLLEKLESPESERYIDAVNFQRRVISRAAREEGIIFLSGQELSELTDIIIASADKSTDFAKAIGLNISNPCFKYSKEKELFITLGQKLIRRGRPDILLQTILQGLKKSRGHEWWIEHLIDTMRNNEQVRGEMTSEYMQTVMRYAFISCFRQGARNALIGNRDVFGGNWDRALQDLYLSGHQHMAMSYGYDPPDDLGDPTGLGNSDYNSQGEQAKHLSISPAKVIVCVGLLGCIVYVSKKVRAWLNKYDWLSSEQDKAKQPHNENDTVSTQASWAA